MVGSIRFDYGFIVSTFCCIDRKEALEFAVCRVGVTGCWVRVFMAMILSSAGRGNYGLS